MAWISLEEKSMGETVSPKNEKWYPTIHISGKEVSFLENKDVGWDGEMKIQVSLKGKELRENKDKKEFSYTLEVKKIAMDSDTKLKDGLAKRKS